MGVDPAVAGSPVITSVTDLTSLLIYLGIASRVLAI
jgi:Mg/Co/Ni transporter MgtE